MSKKKNPNKKLSKKALKKKAQKGVQKKSKQSGDGAQSQKISAAPVTRATDMGVQMPAQKDAANSKTTHKTSDLTPDARDVYLEASRDNKKSSKSDIVSTNVSTKKEVQSKDIPQFRPKHMHHKCQSGMLRRKVKNLTSALIVLGGFAAGLIFVDVAQFFTDRGLSARAMGEARVVEYDDSTWVKYDEPIVYADVFLSGKNPLIVREQIDEILSTLKFFMPTLSVRVVNVDNPVGRQKALDAQISYTPSMHFSPELRENTYYRNTEDIFLPREGGSYVLRMDQVQIPINHYIEKPRDDVGVLVGQATAPHSIVVFENALCETCLPVHEAIVEAQKQYPQKLRAIYKNISASDSEGAKSAAYAGHCAYAGGHYNAYMRSLYTNDAWKSVDPDAREKLFVQYASLIEGMDAQKFQECYASRTYDGQLVSDIAEAQKLGIVQTPTVFLDGRVVSLDDLSEIGADDVDAEQAVSVTPRTLDEIIVAELSILLAPDIDEVR